MSGAEISCFRVLLHAKVVTPKDTVLFRVVRPASREDLRMTVCSLIVKLRV